MVTKYKVLIDADPIVYRLGFSLEDIKTKATVKNHVEECLIQIEETMRKLFVNIEEPVIVLSVAGKSNFRFTAATIKPYKGNRIAEKPKHYEYIRELLLAKPNTLCKNGQEADDTIADLARAAYPKVVIVSADKDLRQVPGWHYENGEKRPVYFVDKEHQGFLMLEKQAGNKLVLFGVGPVFHLAQAVLGDVSDNVPGIDKWGPVKVYEVFKDNGFKVDIITPIVQELYVKQYGGVEEGLKAFNEVMTLLQMGGHEK